MRTNIVLDDTLTEKAFEVTGLKTKRELVEHALRELIRLNKQTNKNMLSEAFKELHQLKLSDDPFPNLERKNRANAFADKS